MKILVTGSQGFVGRNLVETLKIIRDKKYKTCLLYTSYKNYKVNERKKNGVRKKDYSYSLCIYFISVSYTHLVRKTISLTY